MPDRPEKDIPCPLCQKDAPYWVADTMRSYYRCGACGFVSTDPKSHPAPDEEKSHYDLHENNPEDEGYRQFLERIFHPMNDRLKPRSHGLDFGCGPGPTLDKMFIEAGHDMHLYDPFYAPNESLFQLTFDFITLSEVAEHLRHPWVEIDRLWALLNPNGIMGIMTKRVTDKENFIHWHYKNDPTHIGFFADESFEFLAKRLSAKLIFCGKDVGIFIKD